MSRICVEDADKKIAKRVYEARSVGREGRGRPRRTWKYEIKNSIKEERSKLGTSGNDNEGQYEME